MINNKFLNLNKDYEFDVKVFDEDNVFAGHLKLTSNKILLRVMTERTTTSNFIYSKTINCSSFREHFTLHQIKCIGFGSQLLQICDKKNIGFSYIEFEIGFVIHSMDYEHFEDLINGFSIESPVLKDWVGYTETQIQILEKLQSKKICDINNSEFYIEVPNYGIINLSYLITESFDSYSSNKTSTPVFNVIFSKAKENSFIYEEITKTLHILAFFFGFEFKIDAVKLLVNDSFYSKNTSIYAPISYTNQLDYTLFPLSHNLRFNELDLAPLPLKSFQNYYSLPNSELKLYSRYLGYCRMKSMEEKFLGLFRLLEKLTYQEQRYVTDESLNQVLTKSKSYLSKRLVGKPKDIKSFLARISYLNKSKYNTQTCISKFYKQLPFELIDLLNVNELLISDICKLRNDITHANDFSVTDEDLFKFTILIKVFVYLAMMNQLGIDLKQHWQIVTRIESFYLIRN